jgi:hypothetical protein
MADIVGVDISETVGDWNLLNIMSRVAVNKGIGTPESNTKPILLGRESMSRYLDHVSKYSFSLLT